MATIQPRIQVSLDEKTNAELTSLANNLQLSLSKTAASLIEEALELRDDRDLSDFTNQRIKGNQDEHISHDDAWT